MNLCFLTRLLSGLLCLLLLVSGSVADATPQNQGTTMVEYVDLRPKILEEKRYFLPPYRGTSPDSKSFEFLRVLNKKEKDKVAQIENRIPISLDLSLPFHDHYVLADFTGEEEGEKKEVPGSAFIILRAENDAKIQEALLNRTFLKEVPVRSGRVETSRVPIDAVEIHDTIYTLYVDPQKMPTRGVYAFGVRLNQLDSTGRVVKTLYLFSQGKGNQAKTLTRYGVFPVQISNFNGVSNATLLTTKANASDPDLKGNSIRTTLDVNPIKQSVGLGNFTLVGQQIISTQPLDSQSQIQLLLDTEGRIGNSRQFSEFFFKAGYVSNQIFSNQQLTLKFGSRLSLETYGKPTAVNDILSKHNFIEFEGIGSQVLRRDPRVSTNSPNNDFLFGLRARFVGVYNKIRGIPLGAEYRFYYFPVSNLRAGYAIHDVENYLRLYVSVPGTQGKFNVGYEIGLDESTYKRSKGQWVFNVKVDF